MVRADDCAQNAAALRFTPPDILRPAAFPHPVGRLEVRETNLSWVILTGLYAYKIKKSVKFDFIDASTLANRKHLCEEELRLNRRLAADLYVDVIAITRDADGVRIGGEGSVIEYAVRMKQFENSEELSALLECGTIRLARSRRFCSATGRIPCQHATSTMQPRLFTYKPIARRGTRQFGHASVAHCCRLRASGNGYSRRLDA